MSDYLLSLANRPATRGIMKRLGLPAPQRLARGKGAYEAMPLAGRRVLAGAAPGGRAVSALEAAVVGAGGELLSGAATAAADAREAPGLHALVFDGTGLRRPMDLRALYDFFHPMLRRLTHCGRVLVTAPLPEQGQGAVEAAVARGVEGFVRSVAKEIGRKGATANLAYVEEGAEDRLDAVVRFFCSARSAYVDGQALRVTRTVALPANVEHTGALAGKVALVTGSARGIGAATAQRLALEGAHVVCLDVPAVEQELDARAHQIGAAPLALDIAAAEAPGELVRYFEERHAGLDVLVHNAGITRDRMLVNMGEKNWGDVLRVNLAAIAAVDEALLSQGVLREEARVVYLSSIGGIAGNAGQTNYATTKAALIGYVAARAPELAARRSCINAVAPGFIETRMTAAMPLGLRAIGRRLNSLSQGGQPEDVAELVAFLATPGAAGITGNTIRVCGQGLMGA